MTQEKSSRQLWKPSAVREALLGAPPYQRIFWNHAAVIDHHRSTYTLSGNHAAAAVGRACPGGADGAVGDAIRRRTHAADRAIHCGAQVERGGSVALRRRLRLRRIGNAVQQYLPGSAHDSTVEWRVGCRRRCARRCSTGGERRRCRRGAQPVSVRAAAGDCACAPPAFPALLLSHKAICRLHAGQVPCTCRDAQPSRSHHALDTAATSQASNEAFGGATVVNFGRRRKAALRSFLTLTREKRVWSSQRRFWC
jgi:hypothetical protein